MKELADLVKKKCCYIGHISPSRRAEAALQLAIKFFERENFVPGFGDMLIVTKYPRRAKKYASGLKFKVHFKGYKNFKPDLIWVDDPKVLDKIEAKYPGTPIIHSTSKVRSNGITVLVDSKEQKPLFNGERQSLLVGDYTTKKLLNIFHIERKSPEDLYATITKGHARFRNELIRADVNKIKLVMYVECTKKNFIEKKFPGGHLRLVTGETLGRIIDTIEGKYKMEVVWCQDRNTTAKKVLQRLKREEQIYDKQKH